VAKKYQVSITVKCWPTILNRRSQRNKMVHCPTFGAPGCTSLCDHRHVLVGFNHEQAMKAYARAPTNAERARSGAPTITCRHRTNQKRQASGSLSEDSDNLPSRGAETPDPVPGEAKITEER